jgi:hypothetical protein
MQYHFIIEKEEKTGTEKATSVSLSAEIHSHFALTNELKVYINRVRCT